MKAPLTAILQESKQYTMEVADMMPAGDYHYRPVPEVMSFEELLQHIAYGINWWEENYIRGISSEWEPPADKGGKKAVKDALEKAYATLENTISKKSLEGDALKGFYATIDHITHHRGQATLHLRGKGLVPPAYRF